MSIRKKICARLRLNWPRTGYICLGMLWSFLLYAPFANG